MSSILAYDNCFTIVLNMAALILITAMTLVTITPPDNYAGCSSYVLHSSYSAHCQKKIMFRQCTCHLSGMDLMIEDRNLYIEHD